uniref:tRNA (guanine(26)-N(2))-dimethyltransferase n=1 Tax=Romanomermis culicivorax TaxID=13658 RepID=A0A915JXG0_ROMCU
MTLPSVTTEGRASVSFVGDNANAFYNPVQEFNRDLSGIRILEALSASGLRAIRYAKEVNGIREVVANDFSDQAVACITKNIEANGVSHLVKPSRNDAIAVMHEHRIVSKRFDVVDLDPYGSPAHFLDSAVQSVADDGILMVTCTDMATLCGNTPEACFMKYGSMSLKSKCCHEIALRILLRSIDMHANRYARYIEPLLAVHVDFYIRVFVRLRSGASKAKESCCKTSYIYQCCGCENFVLQLCARKTITEKGGVKYQNSFAAVPPRCETCGNKFHNNFQLGGPIWNGPTYEPSFVSGMIQILSTLTEEQKLGTDKRIYGILNVISEELIDVPLFYSISRLANIVKCPVPTSISFRLYDCRSAILNAGYKVSSSHADPQAIKTNAPNNVIWDILRCWAKKSSVTASNFSVDSVAFKILNKETQLIADFEMNLSAEPVSRKEGFMRFQPKLFKNWGPKQKAKGSVSSINAGYFCGKIDNFDHDDNDDNEKKNQ